MYRSAICLYSLILCNAAFSTTDVDVIHKKDGAILKGQVIEHNLEKGFYKIEIMGGSQFVIPLDDISKITREAAPSESATHKSRTLVQAEPIKKTQEFVPSPDPKPTPSTVPSTPIAHTQFPEPQFVHHVISVGLSSRSYNVQDGPFNYFDTEQVWNLQGIVYSYQYNFTDHWAFYADYSEHELSKIYDSNGNEVLFLDNESEVDDVSSSAYQGLIVLSLNTQEGWHLYTGAGMFADQLKYSSETYNTNGLSILVGLGYAWESIDVQLRLQSYSTGDYEDEIRESVSGSLNIGMRF